MAPEHPLATSILKIRIRSVKNYILNLDSRLKLDLATTEKKGVFTGLIA